MDALSRDAHPLAFDVQERYGKVPLDLLADPKVSHRAIRIFAVLAMHVFEGNTASVGIRRIAEFLPGTSKTTVQKQLQQLRAAGHVSIVDAGPGKRAIYVLMSPVFSRRRPRKVRSGPRGVPRVVGADEENEA